MKITKRYPATDPLKSCPLSLSGVLCRNCRFGIRRYTDEQIMEARERGNYEIESNSFSCVFIASLIELQKIRAAQEK